MPCRVGACLRRWATTGGRTRAIVIDPTGPNVMYAGGVAWGIWTFTDAGAQRLFFKQVS